MILASVDQLLARTMASYIRSAIAVWSPVPDQKGRGIDRRGGNFRRLHSHRVCGGWLALSPVV